MRAVVDGENQDSQIQSSAALFARLAIMNWISGLRMDHRGATMRMLGTKMFSTLKTI